jgi:hypothetical protein
MSVQVAHTTAKLNRQPCAVEIDEEKVETWLYLLIESGNASARRGAPGRPCR